MDDRMTSALARQAIKSAPRPPRGRGRPSREERSVSETRAAILDASLTLFAERGFDGASMRDIAAAVGVEHSLLRYHFGDKATLWRAAVLQMIERLDAAMMAVWTATEGQPLVDRFKSFLRAYVRYCAAHPEHARIIVQESMRPSDRVEWIVETGVRRQHASLVPVLKTLIGQGHLPDVPIPSLIYTLSAAAQTIFMLASEVKAAHGVDYSRAAEIERHADALIALLIKD
jgi:TetR/AcrR family transcriptional regulator